MLEVEHLSLAFRGVRALRDVSFSVADGSVTALIGPNGAGKTTVFNCIGRLLTPDGGAITFGDDNLLSHRTPELAHLGIARTFQHAALFNSLDVRHNVQVGADSARRTRRETMPVDDVLELLQLQDVATHSPESLPLGTKKRVEIARALACGPKLLLLDEPAGGLTHDEVQGMRDTLLDLRTTLNITMLLIEHHVQMVMSMSDHVVVMSSGTMLASGPPDQVQNNTLVVAAYLGG